ncbi:MAG: FtsX-like permease family protein [Bacilli bacterium]
MNILNKLTIKNLKLNKKRTIVTIIGIMLSTALICAVAGMVTSFQKTLAEHARQSDGNYHITFNNVPKEETKYITQNKKTASSFISAEIGYAKLNIKENNGKPYLYIMAYDQDALDNSAINLTKGRMPKNENEIVIPRSVIYNEILNVKIGQKIKLEVGSREKDGKILTQENNPFNENGELIKENLIDTKTKEYTIVGIIDRIPSEKYSDAGYTSITYLETDKEKLNVSVLCKNPKEYKNMIKEISGDIKKVDKVKYEYSTNSELLRWEGASFSDSTVSLIYGLSAIIISIIVVSSIFVIKNSFSISITERTRQYGMFASVGATSKQIKRNVLFEGFILGIIGIPLGILLGIAAIAIVLWIINMIVADYLNGIAFIYSVPLVPILISIIIASLTIFLSSIIPARKAAKISPIDAIRSSNDIKIKSKKLKTPKWFKKIFKIGGEISYKNLKRNKKKYRTTVISIVISVSIFIALASFIQYGFKLTGVYYKNLDYNFVVYEEGQSTTDETYKNLKAIKDLESVDKYSLIKSNSALISTKYLTDGFITNRRGENIENEQYISIMSVESNVYNDYLKKLGLNNKNLENKGILFDTYMEYTNEKYVKSSATKINEGDTINIKISEKNTPDKNYNLEIIKKTNKRMIGLENIGTPTIVVDNKTFEKIFDEYFINEITLYSNDTEKLAATLKELAKNNESYKNTAYINIEEEQKAQSAMILVVSIFLYSFITVITLIGVTNIFNTITTNMILRSKEFAMLKSVGMTKKEFNSMIRLESILYGLKSLLIGIPIGIILSYLIYTVFKNSIEVPYMLPWSAIIISIVFVLLIISITMKYSVNKINKQNIIETIRNDNI